MEFEFFVIVTDSFIHARLCVTILLYIQTQMEETNFVTFDYFTYHSNVKSVNVKRVLMISNGYHVVFLLRSISLCNICK